MKPDLSHRRLAILCSMAAQGQWCGVQYIQDLYRPNKNNKGKWCWWYFCLSIFNFTFAAKISSLFLATIKTQSPRHLGPLPASFPSQLKPSFAQSLSKFPLYSSSSSCIPP